MNERDRLAALEDDERAHDRWVCGEAEANYVPGPYVAPCGVDGRPLAQFRVAEYGFGEW